MTIQCITVLVLSDAIVSKFTSRTLIYRALCWSGTKLKLNWSCLILSRSPEFVSTGSIWTTTTLSMSAHAPRRLCRLLPELVQAADDAKGASSQTSYCYLHLSELVLSSALIVKVALRQVTCVMCGSCFTYTNLWQQSFQTSESATTRRTLK